MILISGFGKVMLSLNLPFEVEDRSLLMAFFVLAVCSTNHFLHSTGGPQTRPAGGQTGVTPQAGGPVSAAAAQLCRWEQSTQP